MHYILLFFAIRYLSMANAEFVCLLVKYLRVFVNLEDWLERIDISKNRSWAYQMLVVPLYLRTMHQSMLIHPPIKSNGWSYDFRSIVLTLIWVYLLHRNKIFTSWVRIFLSQSVCREHLNFDRASLYNHIKSWICRILVCCIYNMHVCLQQNINLEIWFDLTQIFD